MSGISVATINDPEFINLQPLEINPLMSKCEIKVLYTGKNRNHTYITKEKAIDISKTLRGCPIVGWFKKDKDDFRDHGREITFNGDGIEFKCKTRPYGFVAPDAKVWFQEFEDTDEFGNKVLREYLMTTGYLWTGQYEEAKKVIENKDGKPHSMEFDEDSFDGKWSTDSESGMEYFIVNDAIFSKLCILGDDIEPCFEGSSIKSPEVSKDFSKEDNFTTTLYSMMQQLTYALNEEKKMVDIANTSLGSEDTSKEEYAKDTKDEKKKEESKKDEEKKTDSVKEDDKKKKDDSSNSDKDNKDNEEKKTDSEEEDDKKKKDNKYALLESQYTELKGMYEKMQEQCKELLAFQAAEEDKKKDALIDQFYMLSDEDKEDVVKNKSKYTLDEIESKLSVICVRKKVNFNLDDSSKKEEKKDDKITTYNLNNSEAGDIPPWIASVINTKSKKND